MFSSLISIIFAFDFISVCNFFEIHLILQFSCDCLVIKYDFSCDFLVSFDCLQFCEFSVIFLGIFVVFREVYENISHLSLDSAPISDLHAIP